MIESKLITQSLGYIDGNWTPAKSGETLNVVNPATGDILAEVPNMGAEDTAAAIEAAARTLDPRIEIDTRRNWLLGIEKALMDNQEDLARIVTMEQGKPIKESRVEIAYSASFFKNAADNLHHLEKHELDEKVKDCQWTVYHRPAGVVGLLAPWNFPFAMLAKKLAAAVAAGCPSVSKPDDMTPLSSMAVYGLLEDLDFPAGFLNLVVGKPAPIGETICTHPRIRVISFTGSTRVGQLLSQQAAPHIKRLAMELGGNAPYIVFPGADPANAAAQLIPNKFRCAGQTCVCTNRVLVHKDLEAAFSEALVEQVSQLKMGNGLEEDVDIGPLINRNGFDKVRGFVKDALEKGAERVFGDDPEPPRGDDWGCFYPPQVLKNVTSEMECFQKEIFGPVIPIVTFDSVDEAIELANGTPYGLAAYVMLGTDDNAEEIAARLNFGHVGVNTGTGPAAACPFGGVKMSGYGREGGVEALLEFSDTQTVARK